MPNFLRPHKKGEIEGLIAFLSLNKFLPVRQEFFFKQKIYVENFSPYYIWKC